MEPHAGSEAVLRLAEDDPDRRWIRTAHAALQVYDRIGGGSIAGRWVLNELKRSDTTDWWRPGLQTLVRYGILRKEGESVRGGDRAYYMIIDPEGVRAGLKRLGIWRDDG